MSLNTFFDLCSGIGGGRLGLEQCGMRSVGYSDTSRLSVTTYNILFNTDNERNYGNLRKIKAESLPPFDVLIAGFPCQTFSVIGRREGFEDIRGQLIFHIAHILSKTRPKAFILENVRGLVSHNHGETLKTILRLLDDAGYDVAYRVLTSLEYGVPQMRQRVYFIGVHKESGYHIADYLWPSKIPIPPLADYLVDNNPAPDWIKEYLGHYLNNAANGGKYTVDDLLQMEGKVLDLRMSDLRIYEGKVPTLRSQRDGLYYVRNGRLYSVTGHEALLLQGFPRSYADKVQGIVSDRHLLMQAGNAMTVNVISSLGQALIQLFNKPINKSVNGIINQSTNNSTMSKESDKFEAACCDYLNRKYGQDGLEFHKIGGSNSTKPDIVAYRGIARICNIEVKMDGAQCSQFVVLPDEANQRLVYSKKNKPKDPSLSSQAIIDIMNADYERYKNPSPAELGIDHKLYFNRIVDYYESYKQCDYFMTCKEGVDGFIILPTSRVPEYFSVSACYRYKPCGSHNPNVKETQSSIELIKQIYGFEPAGIRYPKKKGKGNQHYTDLYLADAKQDVYKIEEPYRLQIKHHDFMEAGWFRLTILSDINNPNVIFTIKTIKEQEDADLVSFEQTLGI